MKKVSKVVNLSGNVYYRVHLQLINPILPVQLSEKELDVLSYFLMLGDLSKDSRKLVREKLGMSFGSLTNHIRHLKEKGFILEGDELNSVIVPNKDSQEYIFKLVNNG